MKNEVVKLRLLEVDAKFMYHQLLLQLLFDQYIQQHNINHQIIVALSIVLMEVFVAQYMVKIHARMFPLLDKKIMDHIFRNHPNTPISYQKTSSPLKEFPL